MKSLSQSSSGDVAPASVQPLPRTSVPVRVAELAARDGIEFSEIFEILRRHARLALAVAGASFALGMGLVLFSHMRFAATARLYLGELEDKDRQVSATSEELDLAPGAHGDLGSEIEILTSRSLVTRSVLATGLNANVERPGSSPPRYWRWLLSRRSMGMLDEAADELSVADASLTDRSREFATFRVRFTTNVDYELRSDDRLLGTGRLGGQFQGESLTIRFLPGTKRGPGPGAEYDVEVASVDHTVDAALKALEVTVPVNKSSTTVSDLVKVVNLHFTDRSPRKSAAFLDRLILGYLEEHQSWKTENAAAAESFVAKEVEKTRAKLDDLQGKLAAFRAENGDVVLDNEATAMIEQISHYEEQRVQSQLDVESLSSVQKRLEGPNPPVEAFMVGEAKEDPVLLGLASALSLAQQKVTEAEARFKAPAREVQDERAKVDAQLQTIRGYVSSRLERAHGSLRALDEIIEQYQKKLKTVPSAELGLVQLTRETEVYGALYSQLLRRQQEAALVKASTISKNRILDAPEVPFEEVPRVLLGLASAPVGLLLGMMIVVARGLFSGRLQHVADVHRHFADVPILATIPRVGTKRDPTAPECIEAFRTLRAYLYGACRNERGNIVLFTSPCRGDGKTTCAFFLASLLARTGRSALLVDCGIGQGGRPGKAADDPGLGDVLDGHKVWRDVIRKVEVAPGQAFDTMPSGRGSSTDILSSEAMFQLVEEVRGQYDFVLIEAPSYPAVSDTFVLSALADFVVAVLRLEHTPRALATNNVHQLSGVAARYGILVNDP